MAVIIVHLYVNIDKCVKCVYYLYMSNSQGAVVVNVVFERATG